MFASQSSSVITSFWPLCPQANFLELRKAEVRRTRHMRTSGAVELHSWVTTLGQQGTEAEPERLGILRLTPP
jgi:hypothetical protein